MTTILVKATNDLSDQELWLNPLHVICAEQEGQKKWLLVSENLRATAASLQMNKGTSFGDSPATSERLTVSHLQSRGDKTGGADGRKDVSWS